MVLLGCKGLVNETLLASAEAQHRARLSKLGASRQDTHSRRSCIAATGRTGGSADATLAPGTPRLAGTCIARRQAGASGQAR
jgi:hypothetical protein